MGEDHELPKKRHVAKERNARGKSCHSRNSTHQVGKKRGRMNPRSGNMERGNMLVSRRTHPKGPPKKGEPPPQPLKLWSESGGGGKKTQSAGGATKGRKRKSGGQSKRKSVWGGEARSVTGTGSRLRSGLAQDEQKKKKDHRARNGGTP